MSAQVLFLALTKDVESFVNAIKSREFYAHIVRQTTAVNVRDLSCKRANVKKFIRLGCADACVCTRSGKVILTSCCFKTVVSVVFAACALS